jgi:hypothetical protein
MRSLFFVLVRKSAIGLFLVMRSDYQQKMRSLFLAKFGKGDHSFFVSGKKCDRVVLGYAIGLPAKNAIAFFS